MNKARLKRYKIITVLLVLGVNAGLIAGNLLTKSSSKIPVQKASTSDLSTSNTSGIAFGASSGNATSLIPNTKAIDLRVLLNNIEKQHVDMATLAVQSHYDGPYIGTHDVTADAKIKAIVDNLLNNSGDLSQAIGSIYGNDAAKAFLDLWNSHILLLVDYTIALKKNEPEAKKKALDDLHSYPDKISDFVSKANPYLSKEKVKEIASVHIMHLIEYIDAYAKGDYMAAYAKQRETFAHVSSLADSLSAGIIKQFPDKFK